jgi:hypothetical protein
MEVLDSRQTLYLDAPSVRRRRRCTGCGLMITTYEVVDQTRLAQGLAALVERLRAAGEAVNAFLARYDQAKNEQKTP